MYIRPYGSSIAGVVREGEMIVTCPLTVREIDNNDEGNRRYREGSRFRVEVREEGAMGNYECGLLIATSKVFTDGGENLA